MNGELLVKNAVIVSSSSKTKADILIEEGIIKSILMPESGYHASKEIDAEGKYVIPGCVDGHTHMMDPGHTEREDFITGTMAAAVGGVTTIINHHRTVPEVYSVEPLLEKIEYLKDRSCVDFGLKGGISPTNKQELEKMWNEGIVGFKTFTCNLHGVKAMHSSYLYDSFLEVARIDGTVMVHAEDDGICAYNEEKLKKEGRKDYLSQFEWRSKLAERIATNTVIEVAKETKCRVIIAHVSQPELLKRIKEARDEGYEIYAETGPHYLRLSVEDLEEKGPWVKFTPPMNTKENREKMWGLFDKGYVTTIGSDHCPYPKEQKKPGETNMWDAPNGIPGVETGLKILLTGVNEGKTSINKVVECMSENPAKLYRLFPRKGQITVGADADLVILDMEKEEILKNDNIVSKCGWTPYDGQKIKGVPSTVILRGNIIVENQEFKGKVGLGKFLKREKSCLNRKTL